MLHLSGPPVQISLRQLNPSPSLQPGATTSSNVTLHIAYLQSTFTVLPVLVVNSVLCNEFGDRMASGPMQQKSALQTQSVCPSPPQTPLTRRPWPPPMCTCWKLLELVTSILPCKEPSTIPTPCPNAAEKICAWEVERGTAWIPKFSPLKSRFLLFATASCRASRVAMPSCRASRVASTANKTK
jgi:hypothetical protein